MCYDQLSQTAAVRLHGSENGPYDMQCARRHEVSDLHVDLKASVPQEISDRHWL